MSKNYGNKWSLSKLSGLSHLISLESSVPKSQRMHENCSWNYLITC